jgi:hypothetical protein
MLFIDLSADCASIAHYVKGSIPEPEQTLARRKRDIAEKDTIVKDLVSIHN